MSVSGNVERDELTTALRLLARGRSTGVLVASTAFAKAQIGLRDGDLLWASSTMGPKLGEVIVDRGLVRRDKLDAALWVQKQDKDWRALGQVLVDVKLLDLAVVQMAIDAQLTQVLEETLRWDRGTFRFEHRPPDRGDLILPPCRDLGQIEVRIAMIRHMLATVSQGA